MTYIDGYLDQGMEGAVYIWCVTFTVCTGWIDCNKHTDTSYSVMILNKFKELCALRFRVKAYTGSLYTQCWVERGKSCLLFLIVMSENPILLSKNFVAKSEVKLMNHIYFDWEGDSIETEGVTDYVWFSV